MPLVASGSTRVCTLSCLVLNVFIGFGRETIMQEVKPWRAALTLGALAIVSALSCAFLALPEPKISLAWTGLFPGSKGGAPVSHGLYFGLVLAFAIYRWEDKDFVKLLGAMLFSVIAWVW